MKSRLLHHSQPPERVPHVCAGISGALHGLNEMGEALPLFSFICIETVGCGLGAITGSLPPLTKPSSCLPRRAVGAKRVMGLSDTASSGA